VTYWSRQNKVILMIKRNLEINIKQGLILSLGEKPYNMRFPLNLPRWKHSTVLRRTNTPPAVNILSQARIKELRWCSEPAATRH
jgi:hypothetical protein